MNLRLFEHGRAGKLESGDSEETYEESEDESVISDHEVTTTRIEDSLDGLVSKPKGLKLFFSFSEWSTTVTPVWTL